MAAPLMTTAGALSPPIASSAMVNGSVTPTAPPRRAGFRSRGLRLHHLAPAILAAGRANMMRPGELAAIRALDIRRLAECMVRAAHVAARFGDLFLGYGHGELLSVNDSGNPPLWGGRLNIGNRRPRQVGNAPESRRRAAQESRRVSLASTAKGLAERSSAFASCFPITSSRRTPARRG